MTYTEAREKAGIKHQADMAKKMGMLRETYRSKESYEKNMKADELMQFCDITGTDAKELFILGYNM